MLKYLMAAALIGVSVHAMAMEEYVPDDEAAARRLLARGNVYERMICPSCRTDYPTKVQVSDVEFVKVGHLHECVKPWDTKDFKRLFPENQEISAIFGGRESRVYTGSTADSRNDGAAILELWKTRSPNRFNDLRSVLFDLDGGATPDLSDLTRYKITFPVAFTQQIVAVAVPTLTLDLFLAPIDLRLATTLTSDASVSAASALPAADDVQ